MKKAVFSILAASGLLAVATSNAQTSSSLTTSNDTYLRDGFGYLTTGVDDSLDFRPDFTSYFQFNMAGLLIDTITGATLTLHKVAADRNDAMVTGRIQPFGLSDVAGNTEQIWDETAGGWQTRVPAEDHGLDFRNEGQEWDPVGGAQPAFLTDLSEEGGANVTETVSGDVFTLSGPDVLTFLNSRADDDGLVTFVMENIASTQGWGWATKEHANATLHPTLALTYTVIPEPTTFAMLLGGVGVLAMFRRARRA